MAFQPGDQSMLENYIRDARPLLELFSVRGKTAVVTGGTSGLGFDITLRLLQGGANVVVASNSLLEEAAALPLFAREGFSEQVVFCFTDVRREADVENLVGFAAETFGSLDIFVNSAAIWNYAHIYDLPEADLKLVMETNVNGAFFGVKHASKYMIDHGIQGKITLISSNSPWMPYPVFGGYPHYAASKGAVVALTVEAAKELKRFGIMVNTVAPGGMVTPGAAGNLASENITEEQQDEFYDELGVWQIDGQQPVDQIGIVAYAMCTPMSDGMTGACVVADAGCSHNIFRFQPAIDRYPEE